MEASNLTVTLAAIILVTTTTIPAGTTATGPNPTIDPATGQAETEDTLASPQDEAVPEDAARPDPRLRNLERPDQLTDDREADGRPPAEPPSRHLGIEKQAGEGLGPRTPNDAARTQATDPLPNRDDCDSHPPIRITENQGPQGFILGHEPLTGQPIYRPGSGVTDGTGTADDPYIIEDWCITPNPAGAALQSAGLRLEGTTAHVRIQDNLLDGEKIQDQGIRLDGAQNIRLTHNTITNNVYNGVFLRGSSDVSLTNNTITNHSDGVLLFESSDVSLTNNTITDNHGFFGDGVFLRGSRHVAMQGNRLGSHGLEIRGDTLAHYQHSIAASNTVNGQPLRYVRDATDTDVAAPAGQVILVNTTNTRADGLDLSNTSTATGMQLAFTQNTTLANNTITNNGDDGVFLRGSSDVSLTNNTITNNDDGVFLRGSNDVSLTNNTITNNFYGDGVDLRGSSDVSLTNNTITDHHGIFGDGVHLSDSSDVSLTNNTITNNRDGVDLFESNNVSLAGNNIHDNGDNGLKVDGGETMHAEDNWWGAASGPNGGVQDACTGTTADGAGDEIQVEDGGAVCFEPWWTSPNPEAGAG